VQEAQEVPTAEEAWAQWSAASPEAVLAGWRALKTGPLSSYLTLVNLELAGFRR
jgi:hypothetical protein